jgi:hypothetical protein
LDANAVRRFAAMFICLKHRGRIRLNRGVWQ